MINTNKDIGTNHLVQNQFFVKIDNDTILDLIKLYPTQIPLSDMLKKLVAHAHACDLLEIEMYEEEKL